MYVCVCVGWWYWCARGPFRQTGVLVGFLSNPWQSRVSEPLLAAMATATATLGEWGYDLGGISAMWCDKLVGGTFL